MMWCNRMRKLIYPFQKQQSKFYIKQNTVIYAIIQSTQIHVDLYQHKRGFALNSYLVLAVKKVFTHKYRFSIF